MTADTVATYTSHADIYPIARTVQKVADQIISSECAQARVERCQEMATEKSAEQFMTCNKTLWKQRWQQRSLTW